MASFFCFIFYTYNYKKGMEKTMKENKGFFSQYKGLPKEVYAVCMYRMR